MKLFFLYISMLSFVFPNVVYSQITITQSDFPLVGNRWVEFSDRRYGVHLISSATPLFQTWDYSSAFQIEDTFVVEFKNPAQTPQNYQSAFPNANLAIYEPSDSGATYLRADSNGLFIDGQYADFSAIPVNVFDYVPDRCILPTPFTYNSSFSNKTRMSILIKQGNQNFKFVIIYVQHFLADAFGSLKTPVGTFSNTLRVREFMYSFDSLYLEVASGTYIPVQGSSPSDTSIQYSWYQNGTDAYIMNIAEDPYNLGTSRSAGYFDNNALSNQDDKIKRTSSSLKIFPNPSNGESVKLIVSNDKADRIVFSDLQGKQIKTEFLNSLKTIVFLDSVFENGIYVYIVYDKFNNILYSGKIVVIK